MQHNPHPHPHQQPQQKQHPPNPRSLPFQDQLGIANLNDALSSPSPSSYHGRATSVSASDHGTAPQSSLAYVNDEQLKNHRLSNALTTSHLLHHQQQCQCQSGQAHQPHHQYILQPQQQPLLQQLHQQHQHEHLSCTMLASSIPTAIPHHSTSHNQPDLFTSPKHDNPLLGYYNNLPVYTYANESVHSYCLANPDAAPSKNLIPQHQPILNLRQHATPHGNIALPVTQLVSTDSATHPTHPQMSVARTHSESAMTGVYVNTRGVVQALPMYPKDMDMGITTAYIDDRSRNSDNQSGVSLQQDVIIPSQEVVIDDIQAFASISNFPLCNTGTAGYQPTIPAFFFTGPISHALNTFASEGSTRRNLRTAEFSPAQCPGHIAGTSSAATTTILCTSQRGSTSRLGNPGFRKHVPHTYGLLIRYIYISYNRLEQRRGVQSSS